MSSCDYVKRNGIECGSNCKNGNSRCNKHLGKTSHVKCLDCMVFTTSATLRCSKCLRAFLKFVTSRQKQEKEINRLKAAIGQT